MMRLKRGIAALVMAAALLAGTMSPALADESAPAPSESEVAEAPPVDAYSAGTKNIGQGTNAWGWITPAQAGQSVWTEVLLASGQWSRSQTRATDAEGYFVIPLTYATNTVGMQVWRVGTTMDAVTVYSEPFELERTAGVEAFSAGTKRVGQASNTWGTVAGARAGTRVWTEVQLASGWSRSQTRTTDASGYFVIPLTYGVSTPGTNTWRVTTELGGSTLSSEPFTLTRTGGVEAFSAGTKYVGESSNTWGTVDGARAGTRVWTEVQLASGWSRSQTRTTDASGYFVIPLTYGINSVGTTTWRVATTLGGATIRSETFTLTRQARPSAPSPGQYRPSTCDRIKGNINSAGERIYHVPGGAFYNATVIDYSAGERCFRTEQEARAAGWRKSQR